MTCCRPVPRSGLHVDPWIRQKEACDRSLVAVARPVQRRALLLVRRIGVLGSALTKQCLNSRRIALLRRQRAASLKVSASRARTEDEEEEEVAEGSRSGPRRGATVVGVRAVGALVDADLAARAFWWRMFAYTGTQIPDQK